MYLLYAKKNYSDPYYDYKTYVRTDEELFEWLERAVNHFEGVAWMYIQDDENAICTTNEYDKKGHTVDKRVSVEYVKEGDKIIKKTLFCIDDADKHR